MPQLDRRAFLKGSLAGAGALAAYPLIGAAAFGANDRVRVAVAGLNGRGKAHIEAYLAIPGVEVACLVDPDLGTWARAAALVTQKGLPEPRCLTDIRRALEDKDLDAVSIATPNHWHSLMTIWACQAGKHVYVEKPCSHDVYEGRAAVAAARKYNRVVQHGTQQRCSASRAGLIAAIHVGKFGKLLVSHGYCCKPRASIGRRPVEPPPSNLDWDLWRGPADITEFHRNLVHYNWHWFWPTGNGDIGNQGVHEMDVARWAIPGATLPRRVMSIGGRFVWNDQGETPNSQFAILDFGNDQYVFFTVRNINYPGYVHQVKNDFYFADWRIVDGKLYARGSSQPEKLTVEPGKVAAGGPFGSFINAVRAGRPEAVNGDILEAHYSSALGHLANISYRLGEKVPFSKKQKAFGDNKAAAEAFEQLHDTLEGGCQVPVDGSAYVCGPWLEFDAAAERFVGPRAAEANAYLHEPNRRGYQVPAPDKV